ncbi:hypothetical protein BKA69DRAFT_1056160 [Paraphysoderma sedebokerense]|nr:hypothetical protein BKA69DRAFT_1056160 [Paraphysoderma sedebokerense]
MASDTTAYIITAAVWNVYILSTALLFYLLRKKDIIRKRNIHACLFQVFFSVWTGNIWLTRVNLWPTVYASIPWILSAISNYFCVINWLFSYFIRTIILLNDYYSAKIASMVNKKSAIKNEEELVQLLHLSPAEKFAFNLQKRIINLGKSSSTPDNRQETIALLTNKAGVIKGIGFQELLKCLMYSTMIELVILLIVLGYSEGFTSKALSSSHQFRGLEWIPLYFATVVFLLLVPAFVYLLRNIKDSLFLRLEQTATFVVFYPFFILYVLTYFVRPISNAFSFGYNLWLFMLLTIVHTITVTAPALYALLKKDSGNQKVLLNNSIESFTRVLNDATLFAELKQILVENFSIENALFLEEYGVLVPSGASKQTHTILDAEGTQVQIQNIVKMFIVSGAPNELNITSKTRKAIVAAWQKGGHLSAEILEPAKLEVIQMMYQNSYPRLLRKISERKMKEMV